MFSEPGAEVFPLCSHVRLDNFLENTVQRKADESGIQVSEPVAASLVGLQF